MQAKIDTSFYPISLEEIRTRIAKKNGRRNGSPNNGNGKSNITRIVNEFREKIIRIDGDIPTDLRVKNRNRFLFISYDQSILTHGIHKYPAKFFPELPRWLLKYYSKENDLILDPFSGSGTTNVEARLLKRNSVGIDVDPFSRFLSKVKTIPLQEKELKTSQKYLLRSIEKFRPSKVSKHDIPSFPYMDNWFNTEIILELAYIRKVINSLNSSNKTKDFFKVCFSSIIRSVSNADDNCTRTVIRKVLNKKVYPADALKKFTERILISVPKMIEFSKKCPKNVKAKFPKNQDARNINYPENHFDLALTSPPYVNAVDYPRTHQLESYWLGLANGSLNPLKKKHVGTESVASSEYKKLHKIGITSADVVINKIFKDDSRRAFIAYKYLSDMEANLKEVYKVLKRGGRYVIVVGNNKIRGNLFENWKYIMCLAENVGFIIEKYFASEIIKHFIKVPREERINTDWILVLRKQ